jgi:hypothetical protein
MARDARFGPVDVSHAVALMSGALVAAALAGALLAAAGVRVITVPAPHDALAPTPDTALALLAHNAGVALWPLALVAVGWPGLAGVRGLGDALVAGHFVGHGALVGSALAQQPGMWRYLPHLPFELLALALPAAAWLAARTSTRHPLTQLVRVGAAVLGLLTIAALLETYAVPLP